MNTIRHENNCHADNFYYICGVTQINPAGDPANQTWRAFFCPLFSIIPITVSYPRSHRLMPWHLPESLCNNGKGGTVSFLSPLKRYTSMTKTKQCRASNLKQMLKETIDNLLSEPNQMILTSGTFTDHEMHVKVNLDGMRLTIKLEEA